MNNIQHMRALLYEYSGDKLFLEWPDHMIIYWAKKCCAQFELSGLPIDKYEKLAACLAEYVILEEIV